MTPEQSGYDLEACLRFHPQPGFALEDVARIDAEWSDGADEPEFAWLLELNDGRWVAMGGGHDYTGWDCISRASSTIHATRDEAIRFGLTQNDRCNLGLLLPGEEMTPKDEEGSR